LPIQDFHVTIATPWWWHTIREGNETLTRDLVARLRQALVLGNHVPFQIELERIILLGGKALVALWRCVGERQVVMNDNDDDGGGDDSGESFYVYDRHGNGIDPMARLRREIVDCFHNCEGSTLTATDTISTVPAVELIPGAKPLTYNHLFANNNNNSITSASPTTPLPTVQSSVGGDSEESAAELPQETPKPEPAKRRNTIEAKTPGLGDHDGFIHTTLARLPLNCLSMTDVELGPIHRLCREATATYCGHRMVISKFRFLETTGAGGESNPCKAPIFDETVLAPQRVQVTPYTGSINDDVNLLHVPKQAGQHSTIGAPPSATTATTATTSTIQELFNLTEE